MKYVSRKNAYLLTVNVLSSYEGHVGQAGVMLHVLNDHVTIDAGNPAHSHTKRAC